jgi:glycosyltransferase involved in cell wall biosynthesis
VPTFSIVIATYQSADTVAGAVESALSQTMRAHEVIVVDDGSTDATQEVLRPYLDRIICIHQDNRGAAAAENVATQLATGDFVAILDADDIYERARVEALTELAIHRPDLDILMTDAYFEVGGKIVGRFCDSTPFAAVTQSVQIFERCFVAWPAVRRDALLAVGGFNESLSVGHDWECWIRLLHGGSAAGIVTEPLMRYRIRERSLTSNRIGDLWDRVRVLELASGLDLSADERRALEHFLPRRRRRALLAETEQALRERHPDARRRSIEVARTRGMPAGIRAKALAAALVPGVAANRLLAREAKTGRSRTKRGVPGS